MNFIPPVKDIKAMEIEVLISTVIDLPPNLA